MAEHVRLRAPKVHGQTLQLPPVSDGASMLNANRRLLDGYPEELKSIRDLARREIKSLALAYSQSYSDVTASANADSDAIVMSGHQPTLYHPGVWFKNFALDSVAQTANATAINLVVDNDLGGNAELLFPARVSESNEPVFKKFAFDSPAHEVPYEMRPIINQEKFNRAGEHLSASVFGEKPIMESLWPEVLKATESLSLPASLAAGRHRLEQKHGLQTIELPVSVLSTSESFARFFENVAKRAQRFRQIYNAALQEFRKVNRIRSRSHPVPGLEVEDEFDEIPFWIWTRELPTRRRLFVKIADGVVELSDRMGWSAELSQHGFVAEFRKLNQLDSDVFIRPRALTTTMFSRLFACDLFIHGIGGAKYDQLGDEIARQFFEIDPPEFMTVTATMKLPIRSEEDVEAEIALLESGLRDLRFHPERELPGDARAVRKHELVRNRPADGSCKLWNDEIDAINLSLFGGLEGKRQAMEDEVVALRKSLPRNRLSNSREFSFVLFPEELIRELKVLSTEY